MNKGLLRGLHVTKQGKKLRKKQKAEQRNARKNKQRLSVLPNKQGPSANARKPLRLSLLTLSVFLQPKNRTPSN